MSIVQVNNNAPIDIKISTITMSSQLPDCTLNLTNIGKYLSIDDQIIGIKYNYGDTSITKGKYSTTIYKKAKIKYVSKINKQLFYNQITLIVNNCGNHVNVKLFGNGSLHLTGCKSLDEDKQIIKILYTKLKGLEQKNDIILLTKDSNGILLDRDNIIYTYTNNQIVGYLKDNVYIINKKEYEIDVNTGMFISKKAETQRKRILLNFDGIEIGYCQIQLLKNKNKFYKKNVNIYYDWCNNLIYYKDIIIGKLEYNINKKLITDKDSCADVLEINYNCNPFINSEYKLNKEIFDTNINCINIYFNINFKINRQKLYEKLISLDYICKYKPESYSGIKMIYKMHIESDYLHRDRDTEYNYSGHCICNSKCTCTNITFLIFQSGNIIATGFKNLKMVQIATHNFIELCEYYKDEIKTKLI